jgi:hypothetical protein
MSTTWKEGDVTAARCPRCCKTVEARFERRSVQLARTRLRVSNVLVDVCPDCDHMIAVAPDSYAQLRQSGVWK